MNQPVRMSALTAAQASFEQPFEMLTACHERVQRMLKLLARLRQHLLESGPDEQAQQAARDVMRYFDQAAPQHHRDEELHVFPPLFAHGDAATLAVVTRLQQDHLLMESRWARARQVLDTLARGELTAIYPDDDAALDSFAGLYADHIQAEEQIAYPEAQKHLDAATVHAMGEEMMRRRGVK